MIVSNEIMNFHNFLNQSWPGLSKILENLDWDNKPYFLDEWLQANWELLVEQQILEKNQFLVPYGYDVENLECRYNKQVSKVTHRIICNTKDFKQKQDNIFLSFVNKNEKSFSIAPPFNSVSLKDKHTGKILNKPFENLEFFIIKF